MVPILSLSTELLTQSFSYLTTPDLHSLSLVNRRFNSITTSLLYEAFSFETAGPHLHLFLRTIIQHPSLALIPRFAKLRRWRRGLRARGTTTTAASVSLFITAAKAAGIYRDRPFPWDVADQEMELLVSLLPNLRELELYIPPVCETEWKAIVREGEKARKGDAGAKLKELRRVAVWSDLSTAEIDLKTVEPFLHLPSLNTLEVRSFKTARLEKKVEGLEEEVRKRAEITFGAV